MRVGLAFAHYQLEVFLKPKFSLIEFLHLTHMLKQDRILMVCVPCLPS